MAKDLNIMLAGFGGQGILFAGKIIAYAGLLGGRQVSWLPSYGPEMRGGTANCTVVISDDEIGSPLISKLDVLITMNLPSYQKFIGDLLPGGLVVLDSSLIKDYGERTDVTYQALPATVLAEENGLQSLANVILVGKMMAVTGFTDEQLMGEAIDQSVSAKHLDLIEANKRALHLGASYQE
ncbi:MAG: 2-oxoacid:acceptor oxidoreductase family protein [Coriobacteriia bacterium]|nr:2-oxoacid:acceptor oxidoreductase family protein [Coriobacteriia bacterium]